MGRWGDEGMGRCSSPHFLRSSSDHLFRFLMSGVLAAEPAELVELQTLRTLLAVLGRAVVAAFALGARQRNDLSHNGLSNKHDRAFEAIGPERPHRVTSLYAMISVIVPAPTVRPPSRIANRLPFSMATGAISSPVIVVLSPGITISMPSGRFSVPVTSVVCR